MADTGITNDNRPILVRLVGPQSEPEPYTTMLRRIKASTGRSGQSIAACVRGLVRHGLAECIPSGSSGGFVIRRSNAGSRALGAEINWSDTESENPTIR